VTRRRTRNKRSRPRRGTGQGPTVKPNRSLPAKDTVQQLDSILNDPRYESFVSRLGAAAQDPKTRHVLRGGLLDGQLADDLVQTDIITRRASNLTPIQYEIDLESTLNWIGSHPENVPHILQGGTLNPRHFGGNPIITTNGDYIVDGHHRWSQVYLINPEARLKSIDLNVEDPEKALRASQVAVAAMTGQVAIKHVPPDKNLYKMTIKDIRETLTRLLTPRFYTAFYEHNPEQFTSKTDVHRHIINNIARMRHTNRPATDISRNLMPQLDTITGGATQGITALTEGQVNRRKPYTKRRYP